MRAMKRIVLALVIMAVAVVIAPWRLDMVGGRVAVSPQIARASCAVGTNGKCPVGSVTPADKEVCVALLVLPHPRLKKCTGNGGWAVPNDPATGGVIIFFLKDILKLLSGIIGLVVLLMIVIAGFQYLTSAGDPARVKAGKDRLQNAIVALLLYLMMFAILTFLVPGGILQ